MSVYLLWRETGMYSDTCIEFCSVFTSESDAEQAVRDGDAWYRTTSAAWKKYEDESHGWSAEDDWKRSNCDPWGKPFPEWDDPGYKVSEVPLDAVAALGIDS